jgi:hypothetical protein
VWQGKDLREAILYMAGKGFTRVFFVCVAATGLARFPMTALRGRGISSVNTGGINDRDFIVMGCEDGRNWPKEQKRVIVL